MTDAQRETAKDLIHAAPPDVLQDLLHAILTDADAGTVCYIAEYLRTREEFRL